MDMSRMNRREIEAILCQLAEWKREEMELIMRERYEAERVVRLHWIGPKGPSH